MTEEEKRKIAIDYLMARAFANPVDASQIIREAFRQLHTDSNKQFEWMMVTKSKERVGDKTRDQITSAGMMRKETTVTALISICEAQPEVAKRFLEALQKRL